MAEFLDGVSAFQGSAASLLALGIVAIITGWLIPKPTVRALLNQLQQEAERWRSAWEVSQAAHGEKDAQIAELLEHARTSTAHLTALKKAAGQ